MCSVSKYYRLIENKKIHECTIVEYLEIHFYIIFHYHSSTDKADHFVVRVPLGLMW